MLRADCEGSLASEGDRAATYHQVLPRIVAKGVAAKRSLNKSTALNISSEHISKYCCKRCGHAFFKHKESTEWRLLNRAKTQKGCTEPGRDCREAIE